ncbi:MAG: ATP-binding protein [Deferribacterales bacterium]
MFNLVKNAIEAGDSRKNITIVLNSYPDKYLISINNPKYIPENVQYRILKDIFTTKKKGSGLWLNCTKILVEKYLGCHIYFTSNIESGTIFSVYLQT